MAEQPAGIVQEDINENAASNNTNAVPEHLKVDKIVSFVENNRVNRRYCGLLTCERYADIECRLKVSGVSKWYCTSCFERFRTDKVYCDADSTQVCE